MNGMRHFDVVHKQTHAKTKMRFEGEPIVSDMEKKLAKGWDTEISLCCELMFWGLV